MNPEAPPVASNSGTARRIEDQYMNAYQPSTPRPTLGLIAVAMAAITIGALVVLPAKLGTFNTDLVAVASAKAETLAPIEVDIRPARIDVIVLREPNVAWALTDETRPNCKPEG
jgi:hypothetical protein